ncbi:MAG TPA: AbrB/MazE/SpoVT family DNA-binding domain-containing protein [Candidatus Saccharimonadales bacterium]|nr:AbrB/MazE/SpoVT family DNA-binding domain-containing protein [Candidatus Saccharimonadales bacterium]
MGTTEQGEENIRKIQTTGEDGGSYMITLPKELVEKLGWRKNQKVTVHRYGQKLIIEDWQE